MCIINVEGWVNGTVVEMPLGMPSFHLECLVQVLVLSWTQIPANRHLGV